MFRVFLSLGSNVGDRIKYVTKAVKAIEQHATVLAVSSVYETEPVGMLLQALNFYNMVVEIETEMFPSDLLQILKKIERELGRKPHNHMKPREIDIDIVMYRGYAYEDTDVKVPHPHIEHRRFVLEPLYELAPTAVHTVTGKTIGSILRHCTDRSRVIKTDHHVTFKKKIGEERNTSAAKH